MNRFSVITALLLTALALSACSSSRAKTTPRTPANRADRIDAILGGRLVLAIEPRDIRSGRGVTLALSDGRPLDARLYRVSVKVPADDVTEGDPWLPPPGNWAAYPYDPDQRLPTPARWVAVVDMPGASDAAELLINGRRKPVNWLPSTGLIARLDRSSGEDPWAPTLPDDARADPMLMSRIASEAQSPLSRWRYRLLLDGLRVNPPDDPDVPPSFARFNDPTIEDLARQNEDRWRIALAWLWNADADAAIRLKRRLSAVIDFGDNRFAPAWPIDYESLDRLLAALLNPALTPRERKQTVELWLVEQPESLAWVVDDGGTIDAARGVIIPSVGIANLADRATLAWARHETAIGPATLVPLNAYSAMTLLVPPQPPQDELVPLPPPVTTSITTHAGRAEAQLPVIGARVPVTPPGLTIPAFSNDHTMETWTALRAPRPRPDWSTAALLHRPAPAPGALPSLVESRRWELFVECRIVPNVGDPSREAVRIYVGPLNKPAAVLKIDITGLVTDALPRDPVYMEELGTPPSSVAVERTRDRWSFRINLPPGSVESDGLVRLGITRTDALGRRSAWPRPMLPWQSEPARAALDTAAWTGLSRPRE